VTEGAAAATDDDDKSSSSDKHSWFIKWWIPTHALFHIQHCISL